MILIERLTPRKRLLGFDTDGNLVARECARCTEYLTISNYAKHSGTNLGWDTTCKLCRKTPERKAYLKSYKSKNAEKISESSKKYRGKNKEAIKDYGIEYRLKRPEILRKNSKKWKDKNSHKCIEYVYVREIKKKRNINTLTTEQKKEIQDIYKKCRELNSNGSGVVYCVDHIVPLTHPDVSGLHAPQNLTILTKLDNSRKHNKFDGTPENESWRTRHE